MHDAAYEYVKRITDAIDFTGATVLEIGSYDVNGTVRPLFGSVDEYIGIDKRDGPGVDLVTESFDGGESFDVVVCCEVLEHTDDPQGIIATAWQALKPGGVLILTAAGPGRTPHNTMGYPNLDGEHYANVEAADLVDWLGGWKAAVVEENKDAKDVYAIAEKPRKKAKKEKGEGANTDNLSG